MALFLDDVDYIPDLDAHIQSNVFPVKKIDAIHYYITSLRDSRVRCFKAKVMYARMLDIVSVSGIEDANGILFIHFPIVELAAALARSTMTVKRSLNELEDAGLILRVRQGFGEPNKIYVLIPGKEDSRL